MSENKKYYWLKLEKDFFKRHDVKIIESMPNGKDYVIFYLKLLTESVSHDGNLRFSETIPYSDEMLATITGTNIDIVRSAIKLFVELHLVTIQDDKTIYMQELNKMIGSETSWAKKKREYRDKIRIENKDNERTKKDNVRQEKEKEIELDKELDTNTFNNDKAFEIFWKEYPKKNSKHESKKKFITNCKNEEVFNKIMSSLDTFKKCDDWTKDNGKFIPYASTWLNQKRYEDEIEVTGVKGTDYEYL